MLALISRRRGELLREQAEAAELSREMVRDLPNKEAELPYQPLLARVADSPAKKWIDKVAVSDCPIT
ncbi:hypothetical protein G7Z17_g11456 [Cylindrodendrum hubeiense]|uniref:Uncharacterized protein n=1 Tax=Cylindrodendrum hubeiense TaxID=595255 RepID=A0A9P5L3X9_9HYPO|nr:hypothetical protein G7Z17_g11456 [Cylindrodendrum hubeiense]